MLNNGKLSIVASLTTVSSLGTNKARDNSYKLHARNTEPKEECCLYFN